MGNRAINLNSFHKLLWKNGNIIPHYLKKIKSYSGEKVNFSIYCAMASS
jgi:hypothetical protein